MNKDTFCILPFIHLYSNTQGIVSPCCISEKFDSKTNLKNSSIDEVYNTSQFKKLRKDLISGKRASICNRCWKLESKGIHSFRNHWNDKFGYEYEMEEDGYVTPDFKYIDIRFSNLCNFKCIMCMYEYSSSHWTKELEKQGIPKVINIDDNIVNQLKPYIGNLKQIYFAGGEPLIMKEHYEMLDYLYENNRNIHIEYNTNLSIIKTDFEKLVNKWKSFKSVLVQVSLDGLNELGEHIRVGMKTQQILDNILLLKENDIDYKISFTVGNYNITNIYEFYKELLDGGYIEGEDYLEFNNYVLTPSKYSIQNIGNSKEVNTYLGKILNLFESQRLKNQVSNIKNIIQKNLI